MYNVEHLESPNVAFIYFRDFVVVEYGVMGAAYFYHKQGFERHILSIARSSDFKRRRSTAAKEDMLKLRYPNFRGDDLYITSLHHRGNNWPYRFQEKLSRLLLGDYTN